MTYLPPPVPKIEAKMKRPSLIDELAKDKQRLSQAKDKYDASYDKPAPKRNEGMRGTKGEIYL